MQATLERYADFAPTGYDPAGAFLDDRQDWIVLPVSITRDTYNPVTLANWEAARGILDDSGVDYEIHRFNHWGPGWFEIILVSPAGEGVAQGICDRLEDYPVLDEEAMSRIEWEQREEDWNNYGRSDFTQELVRLVESWDNDYGDNTPLWEHNGENTQRWCQHSGMPLDVCGCGDCVTTCHQHAQNLLDYLDTAPAERIGEMAGECERHVEHTGEGTRFSHNPTIELIAHYAAQ